jgi:hypothetical protein
MLLIFWKCDNKVTGLMPQQFTSASLSNQPSYQLMIWCKNLSRRLICYNHSNTPCNCQRAPTAAVQEWGQAWPGLSSFRRWVWCHSSACTRHDPVTLRPACSWQWHHALQIPFLPSDTEGISQRVKSDAEEENLCLCEGVGYKQSLIMDYKLKVKACITALQSYITLSVCLLSCSMFLNLQCPPQGTTGKCPIQNLKTA